MKKILYTGLLTALILSTMDGQASRLHAKTAAIVAQQTAAGQGVQLTPEQIAEVRQVAGEARDLNAAAPVIAQHVDEAVRLQQAPVAGGHALRVGGGGAGVGGPDAHEVRGPHGDGALRVPAAEGEDADAVENDGGFPQGADQLPAYGLANDLDWLNRLRAGAAEHLKVTKERLEQLRQVASHDVPVGEGREELLAARQTAANLAEAHMNAQQAIVDYLKGEPGRDIATFVQGAPSDARDRVLAAAQEAEQNAQDLGRAFVLANIAGTGAADEGVGVVAPLLQRSVGSHVSENSPSRSGYNLASRSTAPAADAGGGGLTPSSYTRPDFLPLSSEIKSTNVSDPFPAPGATTTISTSETGVPGVGGDLTSHGQIVRRTPIVDAFPAAGLDDGETGAGAEVSATAVPQAGGRKRGSGGQGAALQPSSTVRRPAHTSARTSGAEHGVTDTNGGATRPRSNSQDSSGSSSAVAQGVVSPERAEQLLAVTSQSPRGGSGGRSTPSSPVSGDGIGESTTS